MRSPVPPERARRWVERAIGRGARVVRARTLVGGVTAAMHQLAVVDSTGATRQVVLRRWLDHSEVDESEDMVRREALALTELTATDVPAPHLLAFDATGDDAGCRATLTTREPGHVHLTPRDMGVWLAQLATMLANIHEQRIAAPPFVSWFDPERADPSWVRRGDWQRAVDAALEDRPREGWCFVHRDYQHFNVLWQRERLTSVVDWVNAATGPRGVDVGHCRLNLAVLFSVDAAEQLLDRYEAEAGTQVDPRDDIHALLSFGPDWPRFIPRQIAGRAPFDAAGATGRVEAVLQRALRRL